METPRTSRTAPSGLSSRSIRTSQYNVLGNDGTRRLRADEPQCAAPAHSRLQPDRSRRTLLARPSFRRAPIRTRRRYADRQPFLSRLPARRAFRRHASPTLRAAPLGEIALPGIGRASLPAGSTGRPHRVLHLRFVRVSAGQLPLRHRKPGSSTVLNRSISRSIPRPSSPSSCSRRRKTERGCRSS